MPDGKNFTIVADDAKRIDVLLSIRLSNCSRSHAADLIRQGYVRVNGTLVKKPAYRLSIGDEIIGCIPPPESIDFKPEPIPLDIVFEDNHLLIVNKPAGLVVHPAPGHFTGTLVNALLYHYPHLESIGGKLRPGIVHRLDKDTSGIMIVAKNAQAQYHLAKEFKTRQIRKVYLALVCGVMKSDSGTILLPIGRHPVDRKKMSTICGKGRSAETSWTIKERFDAFSFIEVSIKTGRTHQIRVHFAAIRHPVAGDPLYGGRITRSVSEFPFKRQMLHAWRIQFNHPETGLSMQFQAPLPEDMIGFLNELRVNQARIFNPST